MSTLVGYEKALISKQKYTSSGIGFVIPKGMYFFYIDGRVPDEDFVKLRLERFGSYPERSPSRDGIHVLGNCNDEVLPFVYDEKKKRYTLAQEFYQKNPNNHIELYFGYVTNRYATFTGDAINDLDFTYDTQATLATLDKDMRIKSKINYNESRDGDRDEFDIVCYLRKEKNGEKFKRVQMPNITPHVCHRTYCSNQAKDRMNHPKTLQYLMVHSDISVTMNVYTHISFDDAEAELRKMEEARKAQAEIEKKNEKPMSHKMFKAI